MLVPVPLGRTRKKLIGAARHWLRGGITDEVEQKAQAALYRSIGIPQSSIERECNRRTSYPVWPENDVAVRVFCALGATQWNVVSGMSSAWWVGLRYESMPMLLDAMAIPAGERLDVIWGVQAMEREAVRLLNERARTSA